MTLRVYNTLSRKKEEFKPIDPPKVGMYVCGVTVYDYSHIGHARSTIVFDVINRYLRYRGYEVTYARNFTDIDDKIINRSNELNISTSELTEKFIGAFNEDMQALRLLPPDIEPRCSAYIPQMIDFISDLVERGLAYATEDGDVYYRVTAFKDYGKLSGKNIEDLEAGARVEIGVTKESPMDFALWKAAKPNEPTWDSPWGKGRPGWHIECSVMSTHNIGDTLDIHGGGKDLIFPHHENEVAQSEAHTGKPYANYWLHNGFVNVPSDSDPSGTKMSKSLGNFYTIRDVLAAYHPETIKFFMLSTHYRNDVLFTDEGLNKAQSRLAYFYDTLGRTKQFLADHDETGGKILLPEKTEKIREGFEIAMDDDFNTQRVFGQLSGVFKLINELLSDKTSDTSDLAATLSTILEDVSAIGAVLGVFELDAKCFEGELKGILCCQSGINSEEIEDLIARRKEARENKDWESSDRIRDQLLEKGVILKDAKGVTTWTVKQ